MRVIFGDTEFSMYSANKNVYTEWGHHPLDIYHHHSYYEILVFSKGDTQYVVEDQKYTLHAGEMIILLPGVRHYNCTSTSAFIRHSLSFTVERTYGEEGCYEYFQQLLQQCSGRPLPISDALLGCIRQYREIYEWISVQNLCTATAELAVLFSELLSHLEIICKTDAVKSVKPNLQNNRLCQLTDMVHDIRVPISKISKFLGYSERNTRRMILSLYGNSISEIRQKIMLTAAKGLIEKNPEIPLDEIATNSGFSGSSAMHRAFLKHENCTPGEYRKRYSAKATKYSENCVDKYSEHI